MSNWRDYSIKDFKNQAYDIERVDEMLSEAFELGRKAKETGEKLCDYCRIMEILKVTAKSKLPGEKRYSPIEPDFECPEAHEYCNENCDHYSCVMTCKNCKFNTDVGIGYTCSLESHTNIVDSMESATTKCEDWKYKGENDDINDE